MHKVGEELQNNEKHVVVQVAIGEMFGMEPGTITTSHLATAFRRVGFDGIFDPDWAADLSLIEKLQRSSIELNIKVSCRPSQAATWVRLFEYQFPDMLDLIRKRQDAIY